MGRKGITVIIAAALALGLTPATAGYAVTKAPVQKVKTLPACRTEDDERNCYWDAKTRGNHKGHSFVVISGKVYYLP